MAFIKMETDTATMNFDLDENGNEIGGKNINKGRPPSFVRDWFIPKHHHGMDRRFINSVRAYDCKYCGEEISGNKLPALKRHVPPCKLFPKRLKGIFSHLHSFLYNILYNTIIY